MRALIAGVAALGLAGFASLALGASAIRAGEVAAALTAFDGSAAHVAVAEVRLPRAAVAAVVGAALGMAGVLMQAISRNPLAEPALLGVSWGAALAVVVGQMALAVSSPHLLVLLAMTGAAAAAAVVVALGVAGRGSVSRENLVVAGAAISGLLAAVVQGILVVDQQSLEVARRWLAGSLSGAGWTELVAAAPYALAGALVAFGLARPLTALGLGDEVARSLGVRANRVRVAAAAAVVALAGASVALAGPVVLVGLVVPHLARALYGHAVPAQLVASAIAGAFVVMVSDIAARVIIAPEEIPVGIVTALVGAPLLLHLARRGAGTL